MLLAVDVGNTQTVLGVYEGARLAATWRVSTKREETADELRIAAGVLFDLAGLDIAAVTAAVLASVVPQLTMAWTRALTRMVGTAPLICSAATAGDAFQTTYPRPAEIGSDRIADTVGAVALYGAPVIVVDFGTATNIEVVDADGRFIGGIIAPGIQTGAQALFSGGAQLAAVDLSTAPTSVIGQSTADAIRSGIIAGEVARVDGLVRRIFKELGYEATVVATGGLAPMVAEAAETISCVNTELTLEGLRRIAERHEAESSR